MFYFYSVMCRSFVIKKIKLKWQIRNSVTALLYQSMYELRSNWITYYYLYLLIVCFYSFVFLNLGFFFLAFLVHEFDMVSIVQLCDHYGSSSNSRCVVTDNVVDLRRCSFRSPWLNRNGRYQWLFYANSQMSNAAK